ncbi:hypothetical protein GCM10012286_13980 [Streptomyces lasiicapitis]|uniref:Uncharacterized protein n=1 Tax=Streptomyces lasiicapitis TaxID=1923961 RepID=A0ABQ2LM95_9ACTN|nr:hypothetical protein GCM10012286_13980 [Streptomyces lasiicapitis]
MRASLLGHDLGALLIRRERVVRLLGHGFLGHDGLLGPRPAGPGTPRPGKAVGARDAPAATAGAGAGRSGSARANDHPSGTVTAADPHRPSG